jgi:hypothetical protein
MPRTFLIPVLACLAVALLDTRAPAADLPSDLALIPGDAAGFVSVDVPGILNSPTCEEVRFVLGAIKPAEIAAFAKKFPVDPTTIERMTILFPTGQTALEPNPNFHPTAVSALVVVGCSKPFDRATLAKGIFPAGRPKSYRGRSYQFDEDAWSGVLALPGDRTFVVGAEDSLVWLIDRLEKGDTPGPLSPARAEAARHTFFAAFRPSAVVPAATLPADLRPLAEAQRICLAIDLDKTLKASLELHYENAAGATAGEAALKAAISLGRNLLQKYEESLKQVIDKPSAAGGVASPGEFPERFAALLGVGVVRRLDEALKALPVEQQGSIVRAALEMPLPSSGAIGAVVVAGISTLGTTAGSTFQYVGSSIKPPGTGPSPEEVRLKKLAAAFKAYHAEHGRLPPAALAGKDGTPLLSWRVALLPYLGEKELHAQFHFDEPWDSLHNKKLIAKMPDVFNKPYISPQNYGRTNAQVVTGPGTLFDGLVGMKSPGGAQTILALESGDGGSVWWTKPADMAFAPGKPPMVFGGYNWNKCWVVFADGTVKQLTKTDDEKTLPELLMRPKDR